MAAYEEAIEEAKNQGFLPVEALAAAVSAESFTSKRGVASPRGSTFTRACEAYARWNAHRAVAYLRERYVDLLPATSKTRSTLPPELTTSLNDRDDATSVVRSRSLLDTETAVRSAQALASELSSDSHRRAAEWTSSPRTRVRRGQRSSSKQNEELWLTAEFDVAENEQIRTGLSTPLADREDLSPAMIDLVKRSGKPLVLADVTARIHASRAGVGARVGCALGPDRAALASGPLHRRALPRAYGAGRVHRATRRAGDDARLALRPSRSRTPSSMRRKLRMPRSWSAKSRSVPTSSASRSSAFRRSWSTPRPTSAISLPPAGCPTGAGSPPIGDSFPTAELGGDVFDYFWLDDDRFAFYVVDVCGHGVGPALVSLAVQRTIRNRQLPAADLIDPASVFASLNDTFAAGPDSRYFTMWYGVYDAKSRRLRYARPPTPPLSSSLQGGKIGRSSSTRSRRSSVFGKG
jgi:hypothetical protein